MPQRWCSDPCAIQDLSRAIFGSSVFVRSSSNGSSGVAFTPSHRGLFHSLNRSYQLEVPLDFSLRFQRWILSHYSWSYCLDHLKTNLQTCIFISCRTRSFNIALFFHLLSLIQTNSMYFIFLLFSSPLISFVAAVWIPCNLPKSFW